VAGKMEDHSLQMSAANVIAAYREGLPVQRQVVLTAKFQGVDETMDRIRSSPAALAALRGFQSAGAEVVLDGEVIDVDAVVQKSGHENEEESTENNPPES